MIDECELLTAYGETCQTATGGLPVASAVMIGIAAVTVAVFAWLGRTGRLGRAYYCDHEYDSYCGRCGLHIDGEDD